MQGLLRGVEAQGDALSWSGASWLLRPLRDSCVELRLGWQGLSLCDGDGGGWFLALTQEILRGCAQLLS